MPFHAMVQSCMLFANLWAAHLLVHVWLLVSTNNYICFVKRLPSFYIHFMDSSRYTVLYTKRVVNAAVFQSLDIFSVMVHAIEIQDIPT